MAQAAAGGDPGGSGDGAGKASKDNAHFVLTNIQGAPHRLDKRLSCPRGEVENRIQELKGGMQLDRTSCSRFQANQFRLLLAAAGYALLQELRGRARQTQFARAQGERLRLFLWKVGVQVTVRRIVVPLPLGAPGQAEWRQIAEDFNLAPTSRDADTEGSEREPAGGGGRGEVRLESVWGVLLGGEGAAEAGNPGIGAWVGELGNLHQSIN